jgi:hypothetical protein
MRPTTIPLTLASLLITGLLNPLRATAQPAPGPCVQITAACLQQGFVPDGTKAGAGLMEDCIRHFLEGTPVRQQGTKGLPLIDPQVVTACKQENPNFGKGGGARQPTAKPSGR